MKKIEQIALRYLCTTITLWSQFSQHNVIVTSYDVICKGSDYLRQLFWNYCILNKGHIIKNSKSKRTVALTATEGTVSPHSEWNANTARVLAMEALHKQVGSFLPAYGLHSSDLFSSRFKLEGFP
ncbi:hypothetical protein CQW23_19050 [Capsicum baccatum]|uniref:SNF2 N-terminal domain-containing protein n=1 Tax=Capsicum baccatum TaxID=33114 RepID=A0A2G2W4N7_CAPBA|nr:hypothetical protein CQW23_19050 [Capsicum baccatum]